MMYRVVISEAPAFRRSHLRHLLLKGTGRQLLKSIPQLSKAEVGRPTPRFGELFDKQLE